MICINGPGQAGSDPPELAEAEFALAVALGAAHTRPDRAAERAEVDAWLLARGIALAAP